MYIRLLNFKNKVIDQKKFKHKKISLENHLYDGFAPINKIYI